MTRGRRPTSVSAADPPIVFAGVQRTSEGIDQLRRWHRARSRAVRRMRRLFPIEFDERWPKDDRPKGDAGAYNREGQSVLRAIAAAHPVEFRAVLVEELKREGIG